MNKVTFDTAKELNQYLKIETESFIANSGKIYPYSVKNTMEKLKHESSSYIVFYPAPTLEELLKASPIYLGINVYSDLIDIRPDGIPHVSIFKSDSLVEAVAKIIIEYYRSKE